MTAHTKNHMYNLCKNNMKQYVLVETIHGEKIDGVIIDLDDDHVYLVTAAHQSMNFEPYRQFGWYGYPPFGYGPYGFPPGGYGLTRLILPLTAIAALSLLPW